MTIQENYNITSNDLPMLYNLYDSVSIKSQKRYITLFKINLVLIVLASILSSVPFESIKQIIAISLIILFLLNLGFLILINTQNFAKNWYNGRAVAESIKTLSWKYMTKGEPYNNDNARKQLNDDLLRILQENKEFLNIADGSPTDKQITNKMQEIRNMPLKERQQYYIQGRIKDQRNWYSKKAEDNLRYQNYGIGAIILCIVAAIGMSILFINIPGMLIIYIPILTTLISSLLAFIQLKQYQMLAQAYSVTAQELSIIEDQANNIQTEDEFAKFVDDSEHAISREHTLWLARKDVFNTITRR